MKKLISIAMGLTIALLSYAQDTVNNFTIKDGTVTWTKVFESQKAETAREWFLDHFDIERKADAKLTGKTPENVLPVQAVGLNINRVVLAIQHPCVVYFTVEFKEDRYRVRVNNIIWNPQMALNAGGSFIGIGTIDLAELALRRGQFAPAFLRHTGEELDMLLEFMFNAPADYISEEEDW